MDTQRILLQVSQNFDSIITQNSSLGIRLWNEFINLHPADIAAFFTDLSKENYQKIFKLLAREIKFEVFEELSNPMKITTLSFLNEEESVSLLNKLHSDKLTDLFDELSEQDLKKYLAGLRKDVQQRVLSLLKFHPESAGGIMNPEAFSLMEYFTVEKSILMLKRWGSDRDVYPQIYVTDREHRLVGYIQLEDLLLQDSQARISTFMRESELIAEAYEDRESIAKNMVHYSLTTVPVVDEQNHFLGLIPSLTLVNVLVEEASEDVQKMSALAPLKESYFETSFGRLLFERTKILIALLLIGSFSTTIMRAYETTLQTGSLLYFASMLVSTGGNTSNQTSAMVIQGLAMGDIQPSNRIRFLRRELLMALMIALILGVTGFIRVYLTTHQILEACVISFSLSAIVMVSVVFGSCIPLILTRFKIDPAFSAGPFLATMMDILGILIYCYIAQLIL